MESKYETNQINHELDQYWRNCDDVPAPKGEKLILFTKYGITQVGPTHDAVIAWMPLPGKPLFYPKSS